MDYSRPELADRLAAEYVSGVLRGPARRRFETLLGAHPGLRRAVRGWQDRLMPLTLTVPPERPSEAVWAAIRARLDGDTRHAPQPTSSWWQRLAVWRGVSAVTSVCALALALTLAAPRPTLPPIVVVLSDAGPGAGAAPTGGEARGPSFVASISADGRAMVTKPLTPVKLQADRSLELWSVPARGAPRSLGVIAADQATVVQRGELLKDAQALAVTLEPAGGSPTGVATGPVLYLGKLKL